MRGQVTCGRQTNQLSTRITITPQAQPVKSNAKQPGLGQKEGQEGKAKATTPKTGAKGSHLLVKHTAN